MNLFWKFIVVHPNIIFIYILVTHTYIIIYTAQNSEGVYIYIYLVIDHSKNLVE